MQARTNWGFRHRRRVVVNSPPNTPTISAGSLTGTGATLTGSAFSDPDVGDTEAAAQWQVTTAADTGYATPVISTGDDAVHLTSYAATGLSASTAYIARVRYKDNSGNYSAYSANASFSTTAGGTTFTNAIHLANSAQGASVAANAAFNDLAQMTVAILLNYSSTGGIVVAKGDEATTGYKGTVSAAAQLDFVGQRATSIDFARDAFPAAGSYQWAFLSYNRATNQLSWAGGPKGGTIAVLHPLASGGGSGANVPEAGAFWIGSNGGPAGEVMDVQFVGYAGSMLTLLQMQAIADDAVSQAALFIDYWKPSATGGSGTSIPSGKSVLPAMVTAGGATVI